MTNNNNTKQNGEGDDKGEISGKLGFQKDEKMERWTVKD